MRIEEGLFPAGDGSSYSYRGAGFFFMREKEEENVFRQEEKKEKDGRILHILVSACLVGENCKWDGGNNRNQALLDFMKRMEGRAEFHFICPERDGGLPTPRPASEIRVSDETVVNTEGRDVTAEFLLGADIALQEAKKYGCTIAILKERSPSCGSSGIYDGTFSHSLRDGMGKTAALLSGYGLRIVGESQIPELLRELL